MPYYSTKAVSDQPCINLVRWRILRTEGDECHFMGFNVDDQDGRVSTTIVQFDAERLRGITSSGRVYELHGPPGLDPDAAYVWRIWAKVNRVTKADDISEDVISGQTTVGRSDGGRA